MRVLNLLTIKKHNMKILIIKVFVLALLLSNKCLSQENTPELGITHSMVDDNNIKIRWQPHSIKLYNDIRIKGISINRKTIKLDGRFLNLGEQNESISELCFECLPMPQEEFASHNFNDQDLANAVYEVWFLNTTPTFSDTTFKQAIRTQQTSENKFTFLTLLTNRNFEIAEALALGKQDYIEPNSIYIYTFTIEEYTYKYTVNTSLNQTMTAPTIFSGNGGDKAASLSFDQSSLSQYYIGYYFEKSIDSINFTPINTAPYIYSTKKDTNLNYVGYFIDSLPQNNVKYYYRVRGATLFDDYGPYSNIISVKGKPARLDILPNLSIDLITATSVTFGLSTIPEQFQSKITDISIYKSLSPLDGFTKVNTNEEIRSEDTQYTDNNLLGSMYYVLTYIDENEHYYKSNAILVQAKDSIPPAVPSGLRAEVFKEGSVILKWNRNSEVDLVGYRLYRANGTGETFIDVLGEDIKDTAYIDFLPNNVLIDSAFYKILALDHRANYSEYSEVVGISRPDAVAPSQPVIFSGIGGQGGIFLNWAPSPSSDVTYHTLERSSDTNGKWSEILSFTPLDTQYYNTKLYINFNYVYEDNNNISYQQYNYRLVAYDDNGNYAASDIVSVTPLPNIVEGKIDQFSELHSCDTTISTLVQSQVNGLNSSASSISGNGSLTNITTHLLSLLQSGYINVATYQHLITQSANKVVIGLNTAANDALSSNINVCEINLRWIYNTHHSVTDLKFEIYRAVNNYTFDLYKTLDASHFSNNNPAFWWKDTEVTYGRRYSYKIVAVNPNNTQTKVSNMITVILN